MFEETHMSAEMEIRGFYQFNLSYTQDRIESSNVHQFHPLDQKKSPNQTIRDSWTPDWEKNIEVASSLMSCMWIKCLIIPVTVCWISSHHYKTTGNLEITVKERLITDRHGCSEAQWSGNISTLNHILNKCVHDCDQNEFLNITGINCHEYNVTVMCFLELNCVLHMFLAGLMRLKLSLITGALWESQMMPDAHEC